MAKSAEGRKRKRSRHGQKANPGQQAPPAGHGTRLYEVTLPDGAAGDAPAPEQETEEARIERQNQELRRAHGIPPGEIPAPPFRAGPGIWATIRHSQCYQTFGTWFLYLVYISLTLGTLFVLFYPVNRTDGPPEESRQEWMRKTVEAKLRMTYPDQCRFLLDDFANAFADFMACITRHSRPLRVCTKCANIRWGVERAYENLQKGTNADDADCHYEIFGQTDIELVTFNYHFYQRMMRLHRCNRCMGRLAYGAYSVYDDVAQFLDSHEDFRSCMNTNSDKKLPPNTSSTSQSDTTDAPGGASDDTSPPVTSAGHVTSTTEEDPADADLPAACSVCRGTVVRQGTLLERVAGRAMFPLTEQVTCTDVVDAANETHRLWRCSGCPVPQQLRPQGLSLGMTIAVGFILSSFVVLFCIIYRCKCCDPYRQQDGSDDESESEEEYVNVGRGQRQPLVLPRRRVTWLKA